MSMLAMIMARGGSKRIPRKNVKEFMGRPMIAYAISAARDAGIFDEVMISTEDAEIAKTALQLGASVPFLRSARTASDTATTRDVVLEVLEEYARRGRQFDCLACLYSCVPFLTGDILRGAYAVFCDENADLLMPVVRYSFPIQRALHIGADGRMEYREPSEANNRTQDLEPTYHDAGMFYMTKVAAYVAGDVWHRSYYEVSNFRAQDIDTPDDWKLAEIKYRMLHDVSDRP